MLKVQVGRCPCRQFWLQQHTDELVAPINTVAAFVNMSNGVKSVHQTIFKERFLAHLGEHEQSSIIFLWNILFYVSIICDFTPQLNIYHCSWLVLFKLQTFEENSTLLSQQTIQPIQLHHCVFPLSVLETAGCPDFIKLSGFWQIVHLPTSFKTGFCLTAIYFLNVHNNAVCVHNGLL